MCTLRHLGGAGAQSGGPGSSRGRLHVCVELCPGSPKAPHVLSHPLGREVTASGRPLGHDFLLVVLGPT